MRLRQRGRVRPGGALAIASSAFAFSTFALSTFGLSTFALLTIAVPGPALAASPGGLTAPASLFALLVAIVMALDWQGPMPADALPAAGAVLAFIGAAAWWQRGRGVTAARPAGAPWAAGRACRVADAAPYWPEAPATLPLPDGIDRAGLLAEMRSSFVQVQAAWDGRDLPRLAGLTTREMFDELCEAGHRDALGDEAAATEGGGASSRTEVVTLQAKLLAFELARGSYLASVEFFGLIREHPADGAQPFRELWLLARPAGPGSAWRLARHQALL